MKRIIQNLLLILLAFSVPIVTASGQEKKNEKKIKIIIDEGAGAKTVLDTVIIGKTYPEKIELKDGTVVFIGEPDMDLKHVPNGKKVIVTINSKDEAEKQVEKQIYIMSSDSASWTAATTGNKDKLYVISRSGTGPNKHIMIASSIDKLGELEGEEGIVISHAKAIAKADGKSFSIIVDDDEEDFDNDATKYVIARDGVVVTVQSDDEEKAKEILKLIQDKLGVKSEEKK